MILFLIKYLIFLKQILQQHFLRKITKKKERNKLYKWATLLIKQILIILLIKKN